MTDKFEIKIDKKEVKNTMEEVTDSDYYKRISDQVKKMRSGQMDTAFKGNADKWREIIHLTALDDYDEIVLSILREEYETYKNYVDPIKKMIGFHKIKLDLKKEKQE